MIFLLGRWRRNLPAAFMLRRTPIRKVGKKKPRESAIRPEHEALLRRFWAIAFQGFSRLTMANLKELAALPGRKVDSRNKFNRLRIELMPGIKGRDCIVCSDPAEHRHHIIALGCGGANHRDNLAPLCGKCHAEIHPHLQVV